MTIRHAFSFRHIRIFVHVFVLIQGWMALSHAQTSVSVTPSHIVMPADPNDPNTWPATFNGAPDMGPYAWTDGPAELNGPYRLSRIVSSDPPLADGTRLYVCRARMPDGGVHPGKFFVSGNQGYCSIGWGGAEKSLTAGYELLVNNRPDLARFLTQTWVAPTSPASATFQGGMVNNAPLRVARAAYHGGWHLGKEWMGKCNLGYGGNEVAEGVYQILSLGFDKAAWQASPATQTAVSNPNDPNTWTATLDGIHAMGPYAWVDGPGALRSDPNLTHAVNGSDPGGLGIFLCRARMADGGMHPGYAWATSKNQCRIGWGGREVVLTEGFEFLVNAQPSYAGYLTRTWSASKPVSGQPADPATTFRGGAVGGVQMRVCRRLHSGQFLAGKEWDGKCHFGWNGQEIADPYYDVLTLGFNKAAWQAAGGSVLISSGINVAPIPAPQMQFDALSPVVVGQEKVLRDVYILQLKNTQACIALALPHNPAENTRPGIARTLAKEGTGIRAIDLGASASGGLPTAATTVPFTWFVRENTPEQGWFRLKWMDTNLCLSVAANAHGTPVRLAACNASANQKWYLDGGGALFVGLPQHTDGPVTISPHMIDHALSLIIKDATGIVDSRVYTPLVAHYYPQWKFQDDVTGGAPKP